MNFVFLKFFHIEVHEDAVLVVNSSTQIEVVRDILHILLVKSRENTGIQKTWSKDSSPHGIQLRFDSWSAQFSNRSLGKMLFILTFPSVVGFPRTFQFPSVVTLDPYRFAFQWAPRVNSLGIADRIISDK